MNEYKNDRYELIKVQAQFETAIMDLYKQFSSDYIYCSLWGKLAEEEKKHSSWLKGLAAKLRNGEVEYNDCTFSIDKLQKSVKAIRDFIERIKLDPVPVSEAFSYAYKIENSIYEKEYLDSFETDSEYIQKTIKLLIEESGKHRDMIIKEAAKFKFSSF